MKVIAATVVLLFLAASLSAQSPTAGANSSKPSLTRKEIRRLQKVKKQALQLDSWEWVYITLVDHTQVLGRITEISNQGIRFTPSSMKPAGHKKPWSADSRTPRLILFSQIQNIGPSVSDQMGYFSIGAVSGLLGPLGWWAEWMILTGRD
jgi:hypothetical protein